jgi:hypothetical protein
MRWCEKEKRWGAGWSCWVGLAQRGRREKRRWAAVDRGEKKELQALFYFLFSFLVL